jgi:hypothetical protein
MMNRTVLMTAVLCLIAGALGGVALYPLLGDVSLKVGPAAPAPPSPFAAFAPGCAVAPVNPDHAFVVAGISQGDTLANVQLADSQGTATIVRVLVTPGSKPVTAVLQAAGPVVWDFEGATGRVARAVIMSDERRRAAVRGLAAEHVEFAKLNRGCPAQLIPLGSNPEKRPQEKLLLGIFGRLPDRIAFEYRPNSVSVPDLKFGFPPKEDPSRGGDTRAERDLLSYHPGGFRIVDAKSLVSPVDVLTPETYPGEAGLIQLERAGAIRAPRPEEKESFVQGFSKPFQSQLSPDYRIPVSFSYVITRGITLPAGLHGAHLKNFLVLSGVPAPRGAVGHGCLAFMDGFRAEGRECYGDAWDGIQTLKKLSEGNLGQCRLLDAPEGASMEAISIYQPKDAKHSFRSKRVPAPVEIKVSKPGKVVLALNTYEPAVWRVSAADSTQIVGVILTGYYSSKIEGIPPDTPVIQIDYESRPNRPAVGPECAPLHRYLGTSFRGGPGAMALDRQITALTGKNVDRLRGDYALGSVEID